ncbi:MAG: phenylacetic acid degradation operon negative regulatory protein [Parcubacteria group bacterium Greene0714_36]|nr:MAG: phenylacetic acid degradation operon negative regulatory protein [Parcubacteria group bacterium Greene0714_36]
MTKKSETVRHFRKESSISRIILEKLAELGEGTLDAFFPRTYGYTAIWRPLLGLDKPRKITRHTVSMNLARLRREGLVAQVMNRRGSPWHLTKKGEEYAASRLEHAPHPLPPKDGTTRLVIFDIPEYERGKRDAIRAELINAGFKQLQKSVWMGERPLTKDFISLIDDLELEDCVHMFSIHAKGTLTREKGR